MRIRSTLVALLSSGLLLACGASNKHAAETPDSDLWAGYQGTYATTASPKTNDDGAGAAEAKSETAKKDASHAAKAKSDASSASSGEASAPVLPKKTSHGKIKGESISYIDESALADATKRAGHSKIKSTNTTVGPEYENVQVTLKNGTTVQIFRPASSPASDGPSVSAPKLRSLQLEKNETGWYDEDADVFVVVNAGKKPVAKRVLGAILKR
jgi:hypothetical protein